MILYHGTTEKVAFESLARGLYGAQRGGAHPIKNGTKQEPRDAITLTDVYAGHMAHAATEDRGSWGVIEVDTNRLNQLTLYPTAEALELAFRDQAAAEGKAKGTPERAIADALVDLDVDQRRQWFRERIGMFQTQWLPSLTFSGFCIYNGYIPSKAIRRVSMVNPHNAICHLATTPVGDPKAHVRDREKHQAITTWLMGGDLDPSPFLSVGIGAGDLVTVSDAVERRVLNNR